ncbi:YfiT family bacillithiol transferase [Pseudotamlana carrageenivorans]|uniref:Metal-dependent hydrolase n=1 Tax=Pseudotamlana carrageenivorans TaxID=2069432 RepID=A0A2I7SDX2_9FLAO|nr:putative metal-dependent hydrolase [Tamlana carrageenivorans]AUS04094.1 metal-dependent hydrolase [Tamlana carrageenivorans]
MTNTELEKLRYPIGKFECPKSISNSDLNAWISVLEQFPKRLESLVENLNDAQLDTEYRPGGWTIRQVIHHVADSHHHSYTRFKWALTEDKPLIKAYYEDRWAELSDSKFAPIDMSLHHIKAIHFKLVYLLKTLTEADLERRFIHPETNSEVKLNFQIGNYAWHSNHHYAHIENVLKQKGWL